jgi:hypothetical protein
VASAMGLSAFPCARKRFISRMAFCSPSCGTSSPALADAVAERRRPAEIAPASLSGRSARGCGRARASAKAAAIVRNSFDSPLPEMSPPRSRR